MQVFIGVLIPFLGTSLGAAMVFLIRHALRDDVQRALTGFASGVMVAASVWSLLIPALEQSASMGVWSFLPAVIGFWIGVLFLLALDHLIPHLHQNSAAAEGPASKLQRTTMMVLAVTLHNIPEGMAVAVPLISGGTGRARATLITAACGLPTLLGAWLGFWLGDIGPLGLTLSLGFASGAMLYVVFGEILPEAYLIYRSKLPAFAVMVGLALGMFMIFF